MSEYGITGGISAVTESMKASREATKHLTKQIELVQKDGTEVAQQKAQERVRARREAEFKKERALIKALEQWQRSKQISEEEAKLKIDFVKKYGAKEWDAVLKIKLDIESLERKNSEEYEHDLADVRRVQLLCWSFAALIAWYLTWGYK